jgi:DNA-binding response OmpR family regulator
MSGEEMKNGKRVLVTDDEEGILNFVRINLKLNGYDVKTASRGEDALNLARTENFDVIILDIVMEPMDGLEVLTNLRHFSQVPVIVFTALNSVSNKALELGANGAVAKPFHPQDLIKKIEEILV